MDWTAAIDKNREALKRVLAMLVAMAEVGLRGRFTFFPQKGADVSKPTLAEKSKLSSALTLPRQLHRAVLRLLRPAEAAARRLIIVAARGLTLPPQRPRQPAIPSKARRPPQNHALRARQLPLLDRLSPWRVRARPSSSGVPRISVPGYSEPFPIHAPSADDPVDATRLAQRLQTLAAALDDLPRQARRFARWRARAMLPPSPPLSRGVDHNICQSTPTPSRASPDPPLPRSTGERKRQSPTPPFLSPVERGRGGSRSETEWGSTARSVAIAAARPRRVWPLRPGWPPGWRRKPTHEVHEVLDVVHGLARWVLTSPDTS